MAKSFLYTDGYGADAAFLRAPETPVCPVCQKRHVASLQAPDSPIHVVRECGMCGNQHRTVDFCPPSRFRERIFLTQYAVPLRPPAPFDDSASPEELERYYEQFTVLRTEDTEKRLTEREENDD